MSISFEQAVDTLQVMFEKWDRDTLIAVFQSNDFHIERTIESILVMEGGVPDTTIPETQNTATE